MPAQPATSAAKARDAAAARRRAAAQRPAGQQRPASAVAPTPVARQPEPVQAAPIAAYTGTPVTATIPDNASANKAREATERRRAAQQRSAASRQRPTRPPLSTTQATQADVSNHNTYSSLFDIQTESEVDALCDIVETSPDALGIDTNSVRHLCRNRRQMLASQGKAATPRKPGMSSRPSGRNPRINNDPQGREAARLRRTAMARHGRSDAPSEYRPTGRVRPQPVPPKVEADETLSGSTITGASVTRSAVTGVEAGSCRTVTGTEYLGANHFDTICGVRPEPNKPKVGLTITSAGLAVSGTEIGRSEKVTGDEQGSCRGVTGTAYLGLEQFASFCENKGFNTHPAKVAVGTTQRKKITVTGVDEARLQPVTGSTAGVKQSVTGSQYSDSGAARMTINGPQKVALTHTIAGRAVTGTEVGRATNVTGDERGSCGPITGTEYLSTEQFQSVCGTVPRAAPAKVGEDMTTKGERITGNQVGRTQKVTGNETAALGRVTGSQYGDSRVPSAAPPKAYPMQTLAGRNLTGNRVDHSPKLTGDERGGCLPVTGMEYYGQEHYTGYCASTPPASPAKVHVAHTPRGQHVSGMSLAQSGYVTGNEYGAGADVSGTPYQSSAHDHADHAHGFCCDNCAADHHAKLAAAQLLGVQAPAPVICNGGDTSVAPAAATNRITGNADDGLRRITGPGNMAARLVSGTPEFRYTVAPAAVAPAAPMEVETVAAAQASRITGDGRDGGTRITGDDWGRNGRTTGTEGRWAQGRNTTLKSSTPTPRSMAMVGAHSNKELERPEAPPLAKVTGSSGNSGKGALITVSGGARG